MGSMIKKVLVVLGVLVLVGCGGVGEEAVAVGPTAEPVVLPTVTAMVRVTPTAGLSEEALEDMWRIPIVVSALNYGICVEGQGVLAALAAGEIERPEAERRLEVLTTFMEVAAEGVAAWEPVNGEMDGLKDLLVADVAGVQVALNGETAGEGVDGACAAADGTGEQVSAAAVAAGMRPAAVRELLDEARETLAGAIG